LFIHIRQLMQQSIATLTILFCFFCTTLAGSAAAQDHSMHQQSVASSPTDFSGIPTIDFNLFTSGGQQITPEKFTGKYLLLAIGFTRCEHICPTIAANMAAVLRNIDIPTSGLFISVDNERDSPEVTDQYAKGFHPDMVGASGDYQALAETVENLNASFVVTKSSKSYVVQHTPDIYLVDPDGDFIEAFAFADGPKKIITALKVHHEK
jgi:protein SCO1/2